MISWIQRTFQRHFKVIFGVMLLLMALPLIWVFNPSSGTRTDDRHFLERQVFGYNLGSAADQSRLFGDAGLSAQLQAGYMPDEAGLQNYAFERAASLQLADALHLPPATPDEVTTFIKNLRVFAGSDGQFDAQRYATFRDSLKTSPRFNEADVSRVIADDVRIANVQKIVAGPGYVLPADVRHQLESADATWTLGVAKVDYASFHPAIAATDAALTKFYEDNIFRYQIPPRVVVSYADFSAAPLATGVTVTDTEVRAYYYANPAKFPKPAKPAGDDKTKPAKPDPEADFAAVRPQVEAALKLDRAHALAMKAASDFSYALYEHHLKPGTPAFDAFLLAQHITLQTLAPFTHEAGPAEFNHAPDVADAAFHLDAERSYSDAVSIPTGAVVLFYKDQLPSRKPLLTEIHDQVASDYIQGERRKQFVELGRTLRATIEARLKAGDTFDKAAAAAATAGNVKIDATMLAPFSRRTPPRDVDYSVLGMLDQLAKGGVSPMTIAQDHGLIVYAADRKLPDLSPANPQYAAMHSQLATGTARTTMSGYFDEAITAEVKKTEPKPE
ncbi:MAG TPA: peptidyl-prolyl cis-trans isomerase [Opitutus sp.]|nr:peptidyl-prolyl cis-trans isomerase [Opitutus sp.]